MLSKSLTLTACVFTVALVSSYTYDYCYRNGLTSHTTGVRLSRDFTPITTEAPIHVVAGKLSRTDLADYLRLVSTAKKPIVSVRLGYIVTDPMTQPGNGPVPAQVIASWVGPTVPLALQPMGIAHLEHQNVAPAAIAQQLKSKGMKRGNVTLGIVQATFTDGTEWTHAVTQNTATNATELQTIVANLDKQWQVSNHTPAPKDSRLVTLFKALESTFVERVSASGIYTCDPHWNMWCNSTDSSMCPGGGTGQTCCTQNIEIGGSSNWQQDRTCVWHSW